MIDCPKHLAPVVTIRLCEWSRIVGLWEAGWTLTDCCTCWAQCICGVSLLSAEICGTFHTHRPGTGRPHNTDVRQDLHIVQEAVIAQTASREEIRVPLARLSLTS